MKFINSLTNKAIDSVEKTIVAPVTKSLLTPIKSELVSRVTVRSVFGVFDNVNKLLYRLDPVQYTKHRDVTTETNDDYYMLADEVSYIIKLNTYNFIHVSTTFKVQFGHQYQEMILDFIGPKRHEYRDKFVNNVHKVHKKYQSTMVSSYNAYNVKTRNFDSIVMDNNAKDELINRLTVWKESRDWYNKHNLVYKIGILLYGPPGTGKSSLIRAISHMFDEAQINLITPDDNFKTKCEDVALSCMSTKKVSIVLFEDIDTIVLSRDSEPKKYKNNDDANQYTLLNLLDGPLSSNNTIYIATTNHKDKLDPALVRHGRFDLQIELTNFNYDKCIEFVNKFGYGKDVLDSFNLIYPVTPVTLQNKVMEYYTESKLNDIKKG